LQDIDLSSNWARKLTERTLDDRVVELEEYIHARSKSLPYTWSCGQVCCLMFVNNLCLWLTFTLAFWASFSANPFQGVLDTAEIHAGRIEVVEEVGLQTRLWAEGATDKAQLSLTVADAEGASSPRLLAEVSSATASSSLTIAGGRAG
jgi:hypothetical protein